MRRVAPEALEAQVTDGTISVFPPPWFMENLNKARAEEGVPPLSMFDGIAMLVWHYASMPIALPFVVVTGI